jgi:hypothetical protein
MDKLARYLGASGSYAAALAVQQHVLHARQETLGAEHPDTLTDRANLACYTGEAGDAAGARDQFAALVPVIRVGESKPESGAESRSRNYRARRARRWRRSRPGTSLWSSTLNSGGRRAAGSPG